MKANEAPDKIYLQVCGDCQDNECDSCKFEDLKDNVTWCKDEIFDKDIEYTRTDAFIEKAQLYLIDKLKEIPMGNGKMKIKVDCSLEDFIEDFENYMKGE